MKKNDLSFLEKPQRQSLVAIFLILLRLFRVIVGQAWPLLLVILFNPSKSKDSYFAMWVVGISILSAVLSIVSYFKFYYYVQGNELIIEKGIFQKTKLNVPFDRIQTVNFKQNILHQFFKVVSLEIDTAGSKGNEFSITALKKSEAEAIRDFLIAQKRQSETPDYIAEEEDWNVQPPREELLLNLSPEDLMKIGVSQNHFRTAAVIFVFLMSSLDQLESVTGWSLEGMINSIPFINASSFLAFLIVLVPLFIIISFLVSLVRTVIRYFNLEFLRTDLGFKVVSGLFTRNEQSANMQKIQLVNWSTNPIRQIFGMYDISLKQAASSEVARKQSIYVPGCYEDQVSAVREVYFPEEKEIYFEEHQIHPLFIYRRLMYVGVVPALLALVHSHYLEGAIYYGYLIWIPIVLLGAWRYWQRFRYFVSDEGIRISKGMIGRKEVLLKWHKIQVVDIQQGLYQRRKDLANVTFHTAAGDVNLPYIEYEKARKLEDFILYKINTSEKEWM